MDYRIDHNGHEKRELHIYFIRHGFTKGNEEGRYVGRTDESLSETGREKLKIEARNAKYMVPDVILVSPMKRCVETAGILFPNRECTIVDDFRECDFGQFEYRNYSELNGTLEYQQFIDSNGMTGFPGGESPNLFRSRCQKAFLEAVDKLKDQSVVEHVALVVHGGTIMSILDGFSEPHRDYFDWQVSNGDGYFGKLILEERKVTLLTKLSDI